MSSYWVLFAAALLAAFVAFSPLFERSRVVVSGVADVGGPFTLTAHTGERISDEAFRGKFMLVAFGFTHCPDVCPAELQVMTAALDEMGPAGERVQPLFITIDPERDTADHLAEYMAYFHPRFIGLTGSGRDRCRRQGLSRLVPEGGRRLPRLRHGPYQHHVSDGSRRRVRAAFQLRHQRRHPQRSAARRRKVVTVSLLSPAGEGKEDPLPAYRVDWHRAAKLLS
jgi:hypothetical protein